MSLTLSGTEKERGVEFAGLLAKALGADWVHVPDPDSMRQERLAGPAGMLLSVQVEPYGNKGRVVVSGDWPSEYYRSHLRITPHPSITCALARGVQAIALDVSRRLLPEYQALLPGVLRQLVDAIDYKEKKAALMAEGAAILGVQVRDGESEMLYGRGSISLQVAGVNEGQFLIYGNCVYVTCEQLRKIKAVVPEMFE